MKRNSSNIKTYQEFKFNNNEELLIKKLSYSPYDLITVRIKSIEDRSKLFDILNSYEIFQKYDAESLGLECDYLIMLKEVRNYERFHIYYTDDYSYYDSGDLKRDLPNMYPKLITPDELDNILKNIIGINIKTMYQPKK